MTRRRKRKDVRVDESDERFSMRRKHAKEEGFVSRKI